MSSQPPLILIPAFNEARNVGALLDEVRRQGIDAEIVVVDDGSTDATAAEARRRGATVLRHPVNLGYGAALHTGYLYARRRRCRQVVQMDADGQHDPKSVPALVRGLERGADVVLGSRYLGRGAPATSLPRRLGSRLLARLVTAWTGIAVTDPTSGYQALSRRALLAVCNDHYPEDFPDADLLITLVRGGLRLVEVPVRMRARRSGPSMHRGGRVLYYAYKMLLSLALLPVRGAASPYRSDAQAETVP